MAERVNVDDAGKRRLQAVTPSDAPGNDNTTTAGKLFSDPQLYDNLSGLTGDLRLLIGDFRKDPKKFLHFKVTVF